MAGIETFPLFTGDAVFESPHKLRVGDDILEGKAFVIGTGSSIMPAVFPGLDDVGYIESDEALELAAPPKSMIVLGGGYVGSELGQFYARIGVPTTIIIRSAHLLTGEDADVGTALTEYFREEGIAVETGARVSHISRGDDGLKVVHFIQDGVERSLSAHEIFYALGRLPNVGGLNLEAAGVTYHAITGISVDDTMRTSQSHIFAVGDVTGDFALVHIAIQQGELAARNAVNDRARTRRLQPHQNAYGVLRSASRRRRRLGKRTAGSEHSVSRRERTVQRSRLRRSRSERPKAS